MPQPPGSTQKKTTKLSDRKQENNAQTNSQKDNQLAATAFVLFAPRLGASSKRVLPNVAWRGQYEKLTSEAMGRCFCDPSQ